MSHYLVPFGPTMSGASSRNAAEYTPGAVVMVSGSRSWRDVETIRREFDAWETAADPYEPVILIHGDARGADRLAAIEATRRGWTVSPYPADWEKHGKRAGILRNLAMLDRKPVHVFIFWDGESRGTKHVIDEVQRRLQSYSVARRPTETQGDS